MANVKGIGLAVHLYRAGNQDNFPKKFTDLLQSGEISPRMLISPVSGKKPPMWDDKKMTLTGDVDYVLLDYGDIADDGVPNSAEMVLLYEKPENYKNKSTVVGYVDGHVMWVKIEDFKKQLKETKGWIKDNN